MGFSLLGESLLKARLPAEHWAELVSRVGYSVGFLIVVLGRQQLFTENTLTPVLPLLHDRRAKVLGKLLVLWTLVFGANIAGAWCIAAVFAHTSIMDGSVVAAARDLACRCLMMFPDFSCAVCSRVG